VIVGDAATVVGFDAVLVDDAIEGASVAEAAARSGDLIGRPYDFHT
jgi:hypothetical protein